MKVIKNYKKVKEAIFEFPFIKIKEDEDVFADLPLCLAEFGVEYVKPIIYFGPDAQIPLVMEENELLARIKDTKLFHFAVNQETGQLSETEEKNAVFFSQRLPEDTPVDKLAIIEGQLGILEDENEEKY